MADINDADISAALGSDRKNNVLAFVRGHSNHAPSANDGGGFDDDELLQRAAGRIGDWKAAAELPSLLQVQTLFHELISDGGSKMLRDKVVDAVVNAFGKELGGKRALASTWTQIAKELAQTAREHSTSGEQQPLTADQKAAMRDALWPTVRELAEAPDLLERAVKQVQSMGVVNEDDVIKLVYIAATSRVLDRPINPLLKGASGGGKTITATRTLDLIGTDFVNYLTSSSALSLVYDDRPLAHTVLVIYEANQLQADENSMFSMLLRTLISEGRIVHQTTVEDPGSQTGRRVERIVREGPIALVITTTGELHAENETRMLSFHISESQAQTRSVIHSLASRAAGTADAPADLAVWHDLQRWIALGPNDVVVPFAPQIAEKIQPLMVRFRRDVGALFNFIKASAILHQAQRKVDAHGRVVATLADYAVAYPIFSKVLAQTSGRSVTDNVRAVVDLITARAAPLAAKATGGKFSRTGATGASSEVELSSEQIGIATGLGKSAAYRAVRSAIDLGFLLNNETRPRKPYRLVVRQPIDQAAAALLPHPDTLAPEGGAT
ncbi:MAG TPA: hypothetical protein VN620_03200 [Candidatus Methylomirabilis sp.]|nr:hypothetical protein [Candidatus Methylomirabilis sp.]